MLMNSAFMMNFMYVFGASLALSVALIFVRFGRGAVDLSAVQASHTRPTSRLGGVAVFGAVFVSTWFWFSAPEVASGYQLFLLASAPLFMAGVAEDLGYPTGERLRLLAAILSGAAFVVAFGQWLPRLDIPIVDSWMAVPAIAIPFTVLACAGVTHAFNLIDGLNGLSAFVSMGVCAALMAICAQVGLAAHFQGAGPLAGGAGGLLDGQLSVWARVHGRRWRVRGGAHPRVDFGVDRLGLGRRFCVRDPLDFLVAYRRHAARHLAPDFHGGRYDAARQAALPPAGHAWPRDFCPRAGPPRHRQPARRGNDRANGSRANVCGCTIL